MVGWLKRIGRSRRIPPTNGPQFDDGSDPYQTVDDWPEKRGSEATTLEEVKVNDDQQLLTSLLIDDEIGEEDRLCVTSPTKSSDTLFAYRANHEVDQLVPPCPPKDVQPWPYLPHDQQNAYRTEGLSMHDVETWIVQAKNAKESFHLLQRLIADERYLVAEILLPKLETFASSSTSPTTTPLAAWSFSIFPSSDPPASSCSTVSTSSSISSASSSPSYHDDIDIEEKRLSANGFVSTDSDEDKEEAAARRWLASALAWSETRQRVKEMKRRLAVYYQTISESNDPVSEHGWQLAAEKDGYTTKYRFDENNDLSFRVTGQVKDCPFTCQIAAIKEADHYHKWLPILHDSAIVQKLGEIEMIVHFTGQVGFIARDMVFLLWGLNAFMEEGTLFLAGHSVESHDEEEVSDRGGKRYIPQSDVEIPPPPKGFGRGRMDIRNLTLQLKYIDDQTLEIDFTVQVNLKLYFGLAGIPQWLFNLFTKKMGESLLHYLKKEVLRIKDDPIDHPSAQLLRTDPFYKYHAVPMLRDYCILNGIKEYTCPPLGLSEDHPQIREDLRQQEAVRIWKACAQRVKQVIGV